MVAVQFIALQFCVRFGGRKAEAQDFDFAQVRFVVGTVAGVDEKIARKALVTLAVGVGYGVPVAKVRQVRNNCGSAVSRTCLYCGSNSKDTRISEVSCLYCKRRRRVCQQENNQKI